MTAGNGGQVLCIVFMLREHDAGEGHASLYHKLVKLRRKYKKLLLKEEH